MRVLILGVSAIALSGCSWLQHGSHSHSHSHGQGAYNQGPSYNQGGSYNQGSYATPRVRGQSKWTVDAGIGTEIITGGEMLNGDAAPFSATFDANNVDVKDAYDAGIRAELGTSYMLSPNRLITANGFYSQAGGKQANIGRTAANARVGTFSDYESYGVEAGLRQYMTLPASLRTSYRPYLEGRIGAAYVDDVNITDIRSSAAPVGSGATSMAYKGGWVPTAAGLVGIEKKIWKNAGVALETGLRYTGELDAGSTLPASLVGVNDSGSRWTVPVSLRGKYRF